MPEITPEHERALALVNSLWNDSEVGMMLQEKAKAAFPDIRTTSEAYAPIRADMDRQLAAQQKVIDDLKAEREADKKEREAEVAERQKKTFEQQIAAAREAYSLTDEGFDKMVARMKETGNYTDPESAAAWVASKTPPKPVSGPTFGPQDLNLFGSSQHDEKLAALHKNPERYMDMELTEFVRDPDKYVRETFAQ
jgi:hypothetical protein